MRRLTFRKASSSVEYAALIALVVGALVAMQVYMKRSFQGRIREYSDEMGEQFSPDSTTGMIEISVSIDSTEETVDGATTLISNQRQTIKKDLATGSLSEETW